MTRLFVALCLLLTASAAAARSFTGEVTYVTDGDSIWVREAGQAPQLLRIVGIDAPEICQAGGTQARAALLARVLHRRVRVRVTGVDDYQRPLVAVRLGREDVGGWLVAQGWAWAHRWHGRAARYAGLEARARAARRGLWAEAGAMVPREFRRRHGPCERGHAVHGASGLDHPQAAVPRQAAGEAGGGARGA